MAIVNEEFKEIELSDYRGKCVVLFFYLMDFTFVWPTEIICFSDHAEEFHKIGCKVIVASVDSQFFHLAWTNVPRKDGGPGPMKIPMLSDLIHYISRDNDVLKEEDGVAYKGLFTIDNKVILHQITINDLPVGHCVEDVLHLSVQHPPWTAVPCRVKA